MLVAGFAGCALQPLSGGTCSFTQPRDATVAVDGAKSARIIARAGKLEVRGVTGSAEVSVAGRACANSQEALDQVELVAERRGDVLHIEAVLPRSRRLRSSTLLDLEIAVPASLPLDISDGSGEVRIHDVATLSLVSSSGATEVDGVAGGLAVRDGTGPLRIAAVQGPVEVTDGAGEISISGIAGPVKIDDGSGSVSIASVHGPLDVRDGSGLVSIKAAAGPVRVVDSSGAVRIEDVQGSVSVQDGSGLVSVKRVSGDLAVKSGSGTVRYEQVSGRVSIEE